MAMLEEEAKDWTKRPSPSSVSAETGAPDQDALAVLKGAYLRSGRVWSALKAARKHNLALNGDHSTISAFANFLNNSWEEDREDRSGMQRVLETIWDECGTSADGGRTENEVEDINGVPRGTFTLNSYASSNSSRSASIYASGSNAEFSYTRVRVLEP